MNSSRFRKWAFAAILICCGAASAREIDSPAAVSPGSPSEFSEIADRCPTFSWGGVAGAGAHELVVYALSEDSPAENSAQAEPEGGWIWEHAIREQLPGNASSWTPPVARCLSPGQRYAWSIRVLGDEGESEWAQARYFTVAAGPSVPEVREALRVLQLYVAGGGALDGLEPKGDLDPRTVGRRRAARRAGAKNSDGSAQPEGLNGPTAIRGSQSDATGTTFGVVGESASPDGFGIGAANSAGGADLVLDGAADGRTDALLTQAGIDRPSTEAETFEITNTGGGTMKLFVVGKEVVTTATDKDTLGILNCASGELAKWGGSAWQCDTDIDTLGDLNCAASGEIAKWTTWAGGSWQCDVDRDTTYTFGPGLVLVNGVVTIDPGSFSTRISTVDNAVIVGTFSSIAIGADGLGLISYKLSIDNDLKVAHCNNTACTSASIATLDSAGDVGWYTSIAIGADGRGLISYFDNTNDDLKVAHCNNTACTSASIATLDSAGDVGRYNSIAIGADGLGLISYFDNTTDDLKVAHCDNAACSSATTSTVDSAGYVGWDTSITIGPDGLGLISYFDFDNADLKVAHCDNTACTSAATSTVVSAGDIGRYSSIAIAADGLGLISYSDGTFGDLEVAHCNNTHCTSATTATLDTLGSGGGVGWATSIAIGADGLGLISYWDQSNLDLKVAHCTDAACTSATTATVDGTVGVAETTSIAIGADGLGLISYFDSTTSNLNVAHLGIGVP